MSMKMILSLLTLATTCIVGAQGFAEDSSLQGSRRSGVNEMFLDAHAPDVPARYSRTEVKNMIRDAKTSEDFGRLADYFDYQALEYKQKTQDDQKDLEQLVASRFHSKAYPTQFDYLHGLVQRDRAKANECSYRANGYRALIAKTGGTE